MKDIIQNNNKNIKIDLKKKTSKISDVQKERTRTEKKCCLQNKRKIPEG